MLPRRVDKQLNTGQLKIVQRASDLPSHLKDLSHVEGLYDPHTNKVYLVADSLNKGNINAVLQHELFHRARATDKKLQSQLDKRLQARFNLAAKGLGTPIEKEAYQRVISAKTAQKDQLEEFQAYLITQYESNPQSLSASLRKWVKDLIATIRAALIRQGLLPKQITPADLSALAKYGAKQGKVGKDGKDAIALASQQGYQGTDKGEAKEWLRAKAKGLDMSHKARMERAIEQGYIMSLDDLIIESKKNGTNHSRIQGSTKESENIGGFQQSSNGNSTPQRFFHGTDKNITKFKLKHEGRKDKGWLGTGFSDKAKERISRVLRLGKRMT